MTKMPQDRREPSVAVVVSPGRKVVRLPHGVSPSGWRQKLRRDQWYSYQVLVNQRAGQVAGMVRHHAAKVVAYRSAAHGYT
jgi:hypothetical protein